MGAPGATTERLPKPPTPADYSAGLDVHQKTTRVCLMDGQGKTVKEWTISTSRKTLDQLHRDLPGLCGSARVIVGLEASTAGKMVFQHLRKLGREVYMAHPKKLRAITESDTKTDRNDAWEIADTLRVNKFPRAYVPTEEMEKVRTLLRLRGDVVEKLKIVKNQVRALLVKNDRYEQASRYDDIFGVQALRYLEKEELPDPQDRLQLRILLEEGELYLRQEEELNVELSKIGVDTPAVKLLQSVPGIDYRLALTMAGEVGDIHRFPNRKKFAAYCGLVPKNKDSGDKVAVHAKHRHGNPRLTWAFTTAVKCVQRGHSRFAELYKIMTRKLGPAKATMAVAHRIAFVVYAIWKSGTPYHESERQEDSYTAKRNALARRSKKVLKRPSVSETVGKMISVPVPGGGTAP